MLQHLFILSGVGDSNSKLRHYKRLLLELPSVNYCTLKRLVLHLCQYVFPMHSTQLYSWSFVLVYRKDVEELLSDVFAIHITACTSRMFSVCRVASTSAENKMNVANLATTFGPVLFETVSC